MKKLVNLKSKKECKKKNTFGPKASEDPVEGKIVLIIFF